MTCHVEAFALSISSSLVVQARTFFIPGVSVVMTRRDRKTAQIYMLMDKLVMRTSEGNEVLVLNCTGPFSLHVEP